MTHLSLLRRRRGSLDTRTRGGAIGPGPFTPREDLTRRTLTLLCVIALMLTFAALLAGCRSSTRVDGARSSATHTTRSERPGRTIERTIQLRVPGARPETLPAPDADAGGTPTPPGRQAGGTPALPGEARGRDDHATGAIVLAAYAGGLGADAGGTPTPPGGADADELRATIEAIRAAVAAGQPVELTIRTREEIPLAADTTDSSLDNAAPSLRTASDDAAVGFNGSLASSDTPWGGTIGGGRYGITAELLGGGGFNALYLVGALLIAGAVVPVVLKPRRLGMAAALAGAGLLIIAAGVVVEEYPWILAIALVAFVGVLAYLVYDAWRAGRLRLSLETVTRAVEITPDADAVKTRVAQLAGRAKTAIDREIDAAKARAGVKTG